MLHFRVSPSRDLFLSEDWIFAPTMLLIDYSIVQKINKKRTQARKLKELKELLRGRLLK